MVTQCIALIPFLLVVALRGVLVVFLNLRQSVLFYRNRWVTKRLILSRCNNTKVWQSKD